jgi:hypothetical protein
MQHNLPFLDVLAKWNGSRLEFFVYGKLAHTWRCLHYKCNHSTQTKSDVVRSIVSHCHNSVLGDGYPHHTIVWETSRNFTQRTNSGNKLTGIVVVSYRDFEGMWIMGFCCSVKHPQALVAMCRNVLPYLKINLPENKCCGGQLRTNLRAGHLSPASNRSRSKQIFILIRTFRNWIYTIFFFSRWVLCGCNKILFNIIQ